MFFELVEISELVSAFFVLDHESVIAYASDWHKCVEAWTALRLKCCISFWSAGVAGHGSTHGIDFVVRKDMFPMWK